MDNNIAYQILLASYLFGFLLMIFYDFFNRLFYKQKGHLIRYLLESLFFLIATLIFFIIMLTIANAKFNIFIPLFIFLGIITYMLFLESYFQKVYQVIFLKIGDFLEKKRLLIKNKFAIIKKKRIKAKHEKNQRSKRKNSRQKQN